MSQLVGTFPITLPQIAHNLGLAGHVLGVFPLINPDMEHAK